MTLSDHFHRGSQDTAALARRQAHVRASVFFQQDRLHDSLDCGGPVAAEPKVRFRLPACGLSPLPTLSGPATGPASSIADDVKGLRPARLRRAAVLEMRAEPVFSSLCSQLRRPRK